MKKQPPELSNTPPLNLSWLLLMAWRDSRRNRSRLLLFGSSVILGIAALVAIYSLGDNLRKNVDLQAAALMGADLEISGNKPPSLDVQRFIDSISIQKSEERRFASMIYFPAAKGSRLVQVRALEGAFPYYGVLETTPAGGAQSFRNRRAALVDRSLMLQYGAKNGDSVMIGDLSFIIEATLLKAPGQTGISASVAPIVYIPLKYLEATGLLKKGSRIAYSTYIKFDKPINTEQLVQNIEPRLEAEGLDYETIDTRKEDTGRSFRDLNRFLELVAFIALLLGCIGVGSAIHIYTREKINMIAILRCIGARSSQAFLIFLIQVLAIAIISSVAGAALGTGIQQFLPLLLKDFLPVQISATVSWPAIGQGIAIGIIISILFALLPLITIRNISPLNALRISFQEKKSRIAPLKWLICFLIFMFIYLLINMQLHNWERSIIFMANILAALLVLSGVAALLMRLARRFLPSSWSYVWRQGLSNLYRPNNQTFLLIISIGFGAAFISALFFIQSILINRITLTVSGDQNNIVLFDIQTNQREEVLQMARRQGLPLQPTVPVVNMRLEQINGLTATDIQEDTTHGMSARMFGREYRVTYRDSLTPSETITAGEWQGSVEGPAKTVYISIEQGFASRNKIELGDTLVFNVQGALVPTVVGSMREVNWNRIQTNFLVVFPTGIIEEAPQFHVFLTHASSPEASALFQQTIVRRFPNISIIDLALVLGVIDDIMKKIAFVIRFIAAFSIITGLVVLIASVFISKYQRVQENVLLRTLGASSKQILIITALEYFFLGAMAAATGILLSLAGCWALAHYVFEASFTPGLLPIAVIFISVCLLTIAIGLGNSRDILNKSPLEILRREA